MRHKEISRRDLRILKSICSWPGKSEYEYFGFPLADARSARKLGRVSRVGGSQFSALRDMLSGIERREFSVLFDAEEWIAECNTWGELERAPKSGLRR